MNIDFYKNLEPIDDFSNLYNQTIYKEFPSDWHLIASDVKDSTKNISDGKYKEINMIAAMCIVSIINLDRNLEIPYIFGGDGVFLVIPDNFLKDAKQALIAVKNLALESYNLELRIASIQLSQLKKFKKPLNVAKYKLTNEYSQALINGDGLDYFDYLLKNDDSYSVKEKIDDKFVLNLEGLECRWNYIKTSKDESISLILKCYNKDDYKDILEKIETIIGDKDSRHPISSKLLELTFDKKLLDIEASLSSKKGLDRLFTIFKLRFINFIGLLLMKFKIDKWKDYKELIVKTTDIQKFDNTVKMVFSSSFKKTKELENYLEHEFKNKKLVFGINKSEYSLMTCLIFERHNKHIHFVDTSNGGYAYAALEFKKRLKA